MFALSVMILVTKAQVQVPVLQEHFDGSSIPAGWNAIDADGDGQNWFVYSDGYQESNCVTSESYSNTTLDPFDPDNWLITPAIALNGTSTLTYYVKSTSAGYPDHYGVWISTSSTINLNDFTQLIDESETTGFWTLKTIDLSDYAGNTVYIAFRHFNSEDMLAINIDEVTVTSSLSEPTIVVTPANINFGTQIVDVASSAQSILVQGANLTSDINAAVSAPFEISLDGENFNDMQTLPSTGGNIYVRCWASEAGSFNEDIILSSGSVNEVVPVSVYVSSCISPVNLMVSQIAGTSANLSWSLSDEPTGFEQYHILFAEHESTDWAEETTDNLFYLLSGLQPQTMYDVKLYLTCEAGVSDTLSTSFITNCLAGGDVVIGNGNRSSEYLPSYNYYNYGYSQQLFLATELNGPHTFNSLSIEKECGTMPRGLKFYLMHTTATSIPESWITVDNAQLVYDSIPNIEVGWNTFSFSNNFEYNGTDNLLLITIDNTGSYGTSSTDNMWKVHNGPDNSSRYAYQDGHTYDIASLPLNSDNQYTASIRNNVVLGAECNSTTTCVAPNVVVTDVTSNEISISWVAGYQESSWNIEYKAATEDAWISVGSVEETYFTLEELQANTTYMIHVYSNCDGEQSAPALLNVTTECSTFSLPFSENFDAVDPETSIIPCWAKGTNDEYIDYPNICTWTSHSESQSMGFYSSESEYSYLALPAFDEEVEMNNLLLSFYVNASSTDYPIEVGVMTDPENYSTFTTISQFSTSQENEWELVEISTADYTGNGRYLALRTPAGDYSYMYVDDIYVDVIPSCFHVTNLEAANITTDEAEIHWTAGGEENAWQYLFGQYGTVNPEEDAFTNTNTNTVTLTDLTPNTLYVVYVKADCGGETSTAQMINFRTGCTAITQLPYIENFDTYQGVTSYWNSEANNLPNCWDYLNTGSSAEFLPLIFNNAETAASGNNSIYYYTYDDPYWSSGYGDQIAILPEMDESLPINTTMLTFDARAKNDYTELHLVVGAMSDPEDVSTFVAIDTIVTTSADYTNYEVYLSSYAGDGNRIALAAFPASTYENAGYVDNVQILPMTSCARPTNLTATTIDATSINLAWTANGGETEWVVEYGPVGFTLGQGTIIDQVTTNPYMVEGLTVNTAYDFYVKAICASVEPSNYSVVATARTYQVPATTPYFHDFSNAEENAQWTLENGPCTNKWYIGQPTSYNDEVLFVSNNGTTANYSINASSSVWAYRDVQFGTQAAEFELSFNWMAMGEQGYDRLEVYAGDRLNVSAGTSYPSTTVANLQLLGSSLCHQNSWQHFSATMNDTYAGQTKRIYFLWTNDGGVGENPPAVIDSISIIEINCANPHDVVVSNITTTSATVTFAAAATATAWQYVLSTTPISPEEGSIQDITSTTINLSDLDLSTTYYVYVRTNCGGGEFSDWTEEVSFTTDCAAITTFPYTEDFENGGAMPSCWKQEYVQGEVDWTFQAGANVSSNIQTAHSGNYNAYYFNTENSTTKLISPTLDLTNVNNPYLSFWHAQAMWVYDLDNLTVYYRTSSAAPWTQLINFTSDTPAWTYDSLSLPNPSATYQIAFEGIARYGYGVVLDDITVAEHIHVPEPCDVPTSLTVSNVDATSADVDWASSGNEISWKLQYKTENGAWSDDINVSAKPYHLSGLTQGTTYVVRVKSICAEGESDWSNTCNFTTTTVGIDNVVLSNNISILPNPADNYIKLNVNSDVNVKEAALYNAFGQLIQLIQLTDNHARIDISAMASGMYFIRIEGDNGVATKKFIKK